MRERGGAGRSKSGHILSLRGSGPTVHAGAAACGQQFASLDASAGGALQRSFDSGKTWQTIPVASNVVFRALAANDSDIWVGGAAGALYHSSDAGQHWTRITPVADGKPLTSDIVTVEFSEPNTAN